VEQNPEKQSGIERVLKISPEEEATLLEHFERTLRNQGIGSHEKEKGAEELEIINGILGRISDFARGYGGKAVRGLTPANIHLIDTAKLSPDDKAAIQRADVGAIYDFRTQSAIVLPEKDSRLITAQRIVHELIHLHAFTSLEAEKEPSSESSSLLTVQGKELHPRRIGFGVFDATHTKRYFRDLDEAIIEELSSRFDARYFAEIPALASELERRETMRKKVKRDAREIAAVVSKQSGDDQWKTSIEAWRYGTQRERLRSLVHQIYEAHRDEFASEEDVFAVFAKAVMTGRLLETARLIEKTFGKGSFARLGRETMIEGGSAENR
jgi:hypothetical protein